MTKTEMIERIESEVGRVFYYGTTNDVYVEPRDFPTERGAEKMAHFGSVQQAYRHYFTN